MVTCGPLHACKLPLPPSCVLTEDKVRHSAVGSIFAGLDKYTLFAMFLLWQERVPDSHWRAYLDVLPRNIDFHPITYIELAVTSPEVEAELKKHPLLHRALLAQKEKLDKEWASTQKILDKQRSVCSSGAAPSGLAELLAPDSPAVSFEQFRWANCMVISRAFNLGDVPGSMCMLPFVDSMNHDSTAPTVKWLRKLFSGFFVMMIKQPLEEGTELTAAYHEAPSDAKGKQTSDLRTFLMYGFVEGGGVYDDLQRASATATAMNETIAATAKLEC